MNRATAATLATLWKTAFQPPRFESLIAFAENHIELPPCLTITGKFNRNISPHFIKPLEALDNEHVRKIVIGKPVRGGGTLIADLWHVANLARDAGPSMMVFHDGRVAKEHAQSRYVPMLERCELTRHLLPRDRRRLSYETPLFTNGVPWWISGPAIGRLQAKGVRYLSLDEVWQMDTGTIREALARLGDFQRMGLDKCLITSQAGNENDAFDEQFHAGQIWEYWIRCPGCKKYSLPDWPNQRNDGSFWGITWDAHKTSDGIHYPHKSAATARFECEHCRRQFSEDQAKTYWHSHARYQCTNPEADETTQAFRWTAIIDFPWQSLVSEFLHAKNRSKAGDYDPLIKFYQKRLVKPTSLATVIVGQDPFIRETYDIETTWKDELCRILSVDVQGEQVFYVTLRAWSKNGESRRLYRGVLYGYTALEEFRKSNGVKRGQAFIDSGYNPKGRDGVYLFAILNHWIPVKGVALKSGGPIEFPHKIKKLIRGKPEIVVVRKPFSEPSIADPETLYNGRKIMGTFIRYSSPTMKDCMSALIESGKWIEPAQPDDPDAEKEYKAQMTAEIRQVKKHPHTGVEISTWKVVRRDNHYLDCGQINTLGALLNGVDIYQSAPAPAPENSVDPSTSGA